MSQKLVKSLDEIHAEAKQFGKIIAAPMGGKCTICSSRLQKGELVLLFHGRMFHEDCNNPLGILSKAKIEFANIFDYKEFDDVSAYREYGLDAKTWMWTHAYNRQQVEELTRGPKHAWNSPFNWYGVGSPQEVLNILSTGGWGEGAKIVSDLADYIDVPPPISIRRQRIRDRQGDNLDIHAVYTGNLEKAWERPIRKGGIGRQHIVLIASMQGLGGLSARTYLWRGAACLVLSDLLTNAGYNVEIWAEYRCDFQWHSPKLQNPLCHRIKIKDGRVPIDVPSLASTVCLAGFKRLLGFAAMQRHLDEYDISTISIGAWRSIEAKERQVNEIAGFDGFDCGGDDSAERAAAKESVVKAIDRVNAYHNLTRESQE